MDNKQLLSSFKNIVLSFLLLLIFGSAFSQKGVFETMWDRSINNNDTRPTWFSVGDDPEPSYNGTERGISYSATTGHLYVCSRNQGIPSIHIINPLTGEDIGDVFTNGIEDGGEMDGGGYRLNNIVTTEGGQIVACNMTLASGPPTAEGWIKAFRVYKWSYESVMPEMIIDYQEGGYRLGDKFSVFGDLSGDARIYAVPGENNKVLKWTVTGGIVNDTPEVITLQGVTSVGTSPVVAEVPGTSGNFYVSGKGFLPTYFSSDGTNLTQIAVSPGPGRICGRLAKINNELYMALYQGANGDNQNAILINMTDHGENVGDDDIYGTTPSLSNTVTAWGEGAVDLAIVNDTMRVFVCAPDIGIAGYKAADLISGVKNLNTENIRLSNYPNPFSSQTTIEYTVPSSLNEAVTISIYDLSGKLVREINNTNYTHGKNTFSFNAGNLPNGIYTYKLKAGKYSDENKMLIIK